MTKSILPADSPLRASFVAEPAKPLGTPVIHLTGKLSWNEEKTVRVYTSVAGRVSDILATPGQKVAAGDTLAEIESPDFGQAQADASKAEADMKLSARTLDRLRDLFAHGAAAKKDVEAAEDDFESKKAERERALARLKIYGVEAGSIDNMSPLRRAD